VVRDGAEELDEGHDAVGGCAHVVGRDLADVGVKGRRGRADAQQERHLDEEDDGGLGTVRFDRVSRRPGTCLLGRVGRLTRISR